MKPPAIETARQAGSEEQLGPSTLRLVMPEHERFGGDLAARERAVRRGLLVAYRNLRLELASALTRPELAKTVWPLDCFERLLHRPELQAHIGRSRAARLGNGEES